MRGPIFKRNHYFYFIVFFLLISAIPTSRFIPTTLAQQNEKVSKTVTLTALLTDLGQIGKWDILFKNALQQLTAKHTGIDIQIKYLLAPDSQTRQNFLALMNNQTPVDIVSIDQIWLGEFAQKGLLTDLTNSTRDWGRSSDWYQANWDGGSYNKKIYGIWAWTDIRGLWYWRDLLKRADVDPSSMVTWNGYLNAAKKLNAALRPEGIEGVHLNGVDNSPDMWYPYLWMLGGDILKLKDGHPSKSSYWFPAYNDTEGVKALEFVKQQVNVEVKAQKTLFEHGFANRKLATMLAGSWMPGQFPPMSAQLFEEKVGFIPMFPVPNQNTKTSTTMGGWELGIPITSKNKDLAWELITIILKPNVIGPWLERYGYLPTQWTIGEDRTANKTESSFPYYDQMISIIPFGHSRVSIPEYPQIAEHIRVAIDQIYGKVKEPKEALDEAAAKSAKVLGW